MAQGTKSSEGNQAMAEETPQEQSRVQPAAAAAAVPSRGFFTIYKKGQGYWTRMGTLMGAVIIAALIGQFVHGRLKAWVAVGGPRMGPWLMVGIGGAVFVLLMLWFWKLMNKPGHVDFLIATDSEMKKVNWTTRKELIGSTRVVVFFVILISAVLFLLDIGFGYLFYVFRVLELPPF